MAATVARHSTRQYGAAIQPQAKGDAGIVSGNASVDGVKDYNGIILDPGVFAKSLRDLRTEGRSQSTGTSETGT